MCVHLCARVCVHLHVNLLKACQVQEQKCIVCVSVPVHDHVSYSNFTKDDPSQCCLSLADSRPYADMKQGLTLMKLSLTRGDHSQCGLALGDLAWSNVENQARVGRAGGIPPIIAGMHAHPTHSGTQGGLALGNLASLCVPNRRIIAQAGGIPAILKSMKTNMQYPGVQVCLTVNI